MLRRELLVGPVALRTQAVPLTGPLLAHHLSSFDQKGDDHG